MENHALNVSASHTTAGKKLLMVTTTATTLHAFLLPFADDLRQQEWQVDAAASGLAGYPALPSRFGQLHPLPLQRRIGPELLRAAWHLRRLVRRQCYDLVHVHTPVAAALVRLALAGTGTPVIYTAHGFHYQASRTGWRNRVYLMVEQLLAPLTTHLVTINQEDYQVAQTLRVPASHMPGIGIDSRQWRPDPQTASQQASLRQQLQLPEQAVVFLMIAECNPDKRHSDLINAVKLIRDQGNCPNLHVLLAGQGALFARIRQQIDQAKLTDRIHLLGQRQDIPALIQLSRAVVLPSIREGLPRSLLEAMSMARAIIVSDVRGSRELGQQGGLLHAPENADALAQCLTRLYENPQEAIALGLAGRQAILTQGYDLNAILKQHQRLYATVLAKVDAPVRAD